MLIKLTASWLTDDVLAALAEKNWQFKEGPGGTRGRGTVKAFKETAAIPDFKFHANVGGFTAQADFTFHDRGGRCGG